MPWTSTLTTTRTPATAVLRTLGPAMTMALGTTMEPRPV
jgi:hypothetical protein